jgi:hypothetical protein
MINDCDIRGEARAEFLKRKRDWNNARRRLGMQALFQHLRESFVDSYTRWQWRVQQSPFVWYHHEDYVKAFGNYLTNLYGIRTSPPLA